MKESFDLQDIDGFKTDTKVGLLATLNNKQLPHIRAVQEF
jgi:hypothetical protein